MANERDESGDFAGRVRSAVIWRSGSQILGQLVTWCSTFAVIRLLDPSDYGLFAMTQIVIAAMSLMNGYSFAGALVQSDSVTRERIAQLFGMLILMNFGLAAAQIALAPAAAAYFRQPLIADMLRVQAALHLLTPFIMIPQALLSRRIDFRTQARVNLAAALLSAIAAPAAALSGLGVWTLVIAPLVLFGARAAGLAILGRWWVWPSFRFKGAGATFGFGGVMLVSELLWFVQSQADIFIGGRMLDPHMLGVYATSLFLSQILVNKFVPALNEVAFPAYARIQHDREAVARGFAKAVRIVMLAALPFSIGLSVTAEPLVATMLGPKWLEAAPVVAILGIAMPFVTLQILYAPATNALGRPGIAAWVSGAGAIIMPIAFLIGAKQGATGMALAWLGGFPLLTLIASALSLPVIGVRVRDLIAAVSVPSGACAVMATAVLLLDSVLEPLPAPARLALLVAAGGLTYALALLSMGRPLLAELYALLFRRPAAA